MNLSTCRSAEDKADEILVKFDTLKKVEQDLLSKGPMFYGDAYEELKKPIRKMRNDLRMSLINAFSSILTVSEQKYQRRIVCAALRAEDGSVLTGTRHYSADMYTTMKLMIDGGKKFHHRNNYDQGFVDNTGVYLTRSEAYLVAKEANQIISRKALSFRITDDPEVNVTILYSECLY